MRSCVKPISVHVQCIKPISVHVLWYKILPAREKLQIGNCHNYELHCQPGRSQLGSRCEFSMLTSHADNRSNHYITIMSVIVIVCLVFYFQIVDWLIEYGFTPYWQYFSHITTATVNKQWSFVKFGISLAALTSLLIIIQRSFVVQGGCYPWYETPVLRLYNV